MPSTNPFSQQNTARILQVLANKQKPTQVKEIVEITKIPFSAASKKLNELVSRGLIKTSSPEVKVVGKPPVLYSFNSNAFLFAYNNYLNERLSKPDLSDPQFSKDIEKLQKADHSHLVAAFKAIPLEYLDSLNEFFGRYSIIMIERLFRNNLEDNVRRWFLKQKAIENAIEKALGEQNGR